MDSEIDNSIHVHMSDYKLIFKCCGEGLYFVDLMHIDEHKINMTVNEYSPVALNLLNIVSENKSFFSKKEIVAADEARTLQRRIGYPSNEDLKSYINTGQIINCAPTIDDVQRGVLIYGPLEAAIKGKMTKSKPQTVQQTPRVVIPSPVLQLHPTDEIAADFFCVHSRIYLLMKSRIYKFQGVNVNCKGRGKVETSTALKHFINQFSMRGITITCIHGDNEFEKVKTLMAPIPVECCGREEHVPDIERAIRTVKERTRCTTTALPYKKLPGIMIDSNIQEKITWLNQFPPKNYISRHWTSWDDTGYAKTQLFQHKARFWAILSSARRYNKHAKIKERRSHSSKTQEF